MAGGGGGGFKGIPFIFARASWSRAPISTPFPWMLFTISSSFDLSSVCGGGGARDAGAGAGEDFFGFVDACFAGFGGFD